MKIAKPMKVPMLTRVLELQRRSYFHVTAMLGFPLTCPRALVDELSFWRLVTGALGEQGAIDEGFAKSRGELLVAGSFHAPGGVPTPASYVRARVGSVDKRLAVVGDRTWRDGVPTEPAPMTTLRIDWAHAFGGAGYDRNPHGKGHRPLDLGDRSVHPLPNVEQYGEMIRAPSERPEPAGFLPMDITFAQRRRRAGTYDKRWLDEHFPGLPSDTDPTFFNVAPEDQWLDGLFRGDEEILIENMHPEKPRLEGRLPDLVTRSFVTHRTPEGDRFLEIPMRPDTVWLFPAEELCVLLFHGVLAIAEDDAADIVHLLCACEEPGSPRPIEHYQAALARRLDKDKGAVAEISDSDLMPPRASGVAPNIDLGDMGRWVKSEYLVAQNMRRGQERSFAEARARVEAEGLDPKDYGLAELPPLPEPPPDDLDALAAYVEAASLKTEELMEQARASEAQAREEARRAWAEMGEDFDAAMEKAAKEGAGPPKFSASAHLAMLRAAAAEAREAGVVLTDVEQMLADPGYHAQIEEQERGLFEMYRRMGHLQPAAAAMEPEASERARVVIGLALEVGEPLANRDFTGANLSGMRLSGVDLSGAFLESADLSGCDLSRANLEGAVLARANLAGTDLSEARLRGANLGGAALRGANLERADLTEAVLSRAELEGARFSGANLTGADWIEAKLSGADFTGATLGECNLLKVDLTGARFAGADLSGANLVESTLDGADFSNAALRKTTFVACRGERVSFRGARFQQGVVVHGSSFPEADFSDADMERANLRGTALTDARLDRANLRGADLSGCDASGASLERAVLKGGLLIRTDLENASLQGANLMDALASKARLAGADFTGANLFRADLSRVAGDERTTFAEAEVGHVRFLPKAHVTGGAS
ncbi:hypothetical protein SOCEGT47_081440 [Sorangium cellulosum]|uniref:DUF2169 domain-containing protein n=1 Tax=Sorangium cellulosum TaxID=56 RepID=A0A4P2QCS4_SORCE|nr:DUF2169 domain-containing protein [Sorangium cellulosum]AUX27550.1 hypothetical protein SOCEGT47_081440 [Sorangium cellulosum]